MKLNGSQILLETLLEQGTDTIFGYPGGAALNIYDELYKYSDRIRHVLAAHEQGASHAADGYARATGKVGVVLATSGPGATNLVTGIATAFMDSIPLIAITANVGTNFIGRDSFQEIYIAGVTMPITKHNFVVRNVEELADTVRQAYEIRDRFSLIFRRTSPRQSVSLSTSRRYISARIRRFSTSRFPRWQRWSTRQSVRSSCSAAA